jgi:hypothetical protein
MAELMSRRLIAGRSFDASQADLFVSALGYESRSLYAARLLANSARRRVAIAFDSHGLLSYDANQTFLASAGFEFLPYDQASFLHTFKAILVRQEIASEEPLTVRVDVSSMSRPMIAQIVLALAEDPSRRSLHVEFLYCPAEFQEPSFTAAPIVVSQPVIPEFAGWSEAPERGVCAVVGLGFEYEQALGALEFLEPAASWAFIPKGFDKRFYEAVRDANKELIAGIPNPQVYKYSIQDPINCLNVLEGLIYGLVQGSRPVLVPFGPKIFALICIVVAQAYSPRVTVWRVSGEQEGEPVDRAASGQIIQLPICFERSSAKPE